MLYYSLLSSDIYLQNCTTLFSILWVSLCLTN